MTHYINYNHSKTLWASINYNVHDENSFSPPVNPAIIIFFTKPVLIKSKYELIDSTHTLILKCFPSFEASACVGLFLKFKIGYQSKGSSIVELSNSSRGGVGVHIRCSSLNSQIAALTITFLILFSISQKLHHVK